MNLPNVVQLALVLDTLPDLYRRLAFVSENYLIGPIPGLSNNAQARIVRQATRHKICALASPTAELIVQSQAEVFPRW